MSKFELQPILQNQWVRIEPLTEVDFESLYTVASDPLLWQQHPNPERYKREAFTNLFKGAMESGGAFLVYDNQTNEPIGSSRFYDFDAEAKTICIGYTFISRDHWGTTYNRALKSLMLNHAFQFVSAVIFHVGALNLRSQKAMDKLGAEKIGEEEITYYGELSKLNFIYKIEKHRWAASETGS